MSADRAHADDALHEETVKYTYYPDREEFVIPSPTMARLVQRMTAPKERVQVEDARENARRILMTVPD